MMHDIRTIEKMKEELSLFGEDIHDISTGEEKAFYFKLKEAHIHGLLRLDSLDNKFLFTYSILLKEMKDYTEEMLLGLFSENWGRRSSYIFPMEINEKWILIGSKKVTYDTYLPGQMKNELLSVIEENSQLLEG